MLLKAGWTAPVRVAAHARGKMYTVALTAHRNQMPSWADNAWFYRANDRTEFDKISLPPRCHLRRYLKGRFITAHAVPGGHLTMLEQPSVQDLARTVRTEMAFTD